MCKGSWTLPASAASRLCAIQMMSTKGFPVLNFMAIQLDAPLVCGLTDLWLSSGKAGCFGPQDHWVTMVTAYVHVPRAKTCGARKEKKSGGRGWKVFDFNMGFVL